jgi:hypothetical protein
MTTLPTIHLNGTSAESLLDEYRAAMKAMQAAAQALYSCTCNARDFYPQGDAAWIQARGERADAFRKLHELEQYLGAWAEHAAEHL